MQLLLVGANHKSAELSAREKLSFDAEAARSILNTLIEQGLVQEAILLSTCNRSEIYAIVSEPRAARQEVVALLARYTGMETSDLESYLYTYYNKFAASHLFEVTAGLDSIVLGENEILRQVKEALDLSLQLESSGAVLNQLFRFAITAGKRVRTETAINRGAASMAGLAARLVKKQFKNKALPRLLIVGAGQMAKILLRNLKDQALDICLVNRTLKNAQELSLEHDGVTRVLPLSELEAALPGIDAAVVCTGYSDYLVTADMLQSSPFGLAHNASHSDLLLVDLSVPRNIDPDCAQVRGVALHDVDALQDQINLSLEQRSQYIAEAQSIIAEETTSFLEWFHNRDVVPTIRGLYDTFEEIRLREIDRGTQKYKQQITPEFEAIMERVTRAITQKILHHPVARLKNASPQEQHMYQEALNALFGLDAEDEIDKYVKMPKHIHKNSQVP